MSQSGIDMLQLRGTNALWVLAKMRLSIKRTPRSKNTFGKSTSRSTTQSHLNHSLKRTEDVGCIEEDEHFGSLTL